MRMLLMAAMVWLLAGCAKYVDTDVSVFHDLHSPLNGASYTIVPSKEQTSSLEFQSYASLLKNSFARYGMAESPYEQARFAIYLTYGMESAKPVVSTYPVYGTSGTDGIVTTGTVVSGGNASTYTGVTFNLPVHRVVGTESRTDFIFPAYLLVDIIDLERSKGGKSYKVYEGRALSYGESGFLAPIMPAMVQSLMEEFPGKSGTTRKIRKPLAPEGR